MSRREIEHHLHSLREVGEIFGSMKTLAYMETRKLARFLDAQQAVVRSMEEVASDFLSYHPETLPASGEGTPIQLLIGAERGFCGNFNQNLLDHLQPVVRADPSGSLQMITVGEKLNTLLEEDPGPVVRVEGAGVVEDVPRVLDRLVEELSRLQARHGLLDLLCLYHVDERAVAARRLLPPFRDLAGRPPSFPYPPMLNQSPQAFLLGLSEHYLFASLHEILYTSLMAENRQRVTHLEMAADHIEEKVQELERKSNVMRQEEITEQIEVILLSASGVLPVADRSMKPRGGGNGK